MSWLLVLLYIYINTKNCSAAQRKKTYKKVLTKTDQAARRFKKISEAILRVAPEVTIELVDSDAIFANVNLKGHIKISRGLVEEADDAEVACILGHEVAHYRSSHTLTRLKKVVQQIGEFEKSLEKTVKNMSGGKMKRFFKILGLVGVGLVDVAVVNAQISQQNEHEADILGPNIAAQAGYDPRGLQRWLGRHGGPDSGIVQHLFSSHPSAKDRIHHIQKNSPAGK